MPALRAPMQLRNQDDLSRLMRLKELNDRTLGQAAHLHHSTIYKIRHGDRPYCSRDVAIAIAEALEVSVDRLFRPATQDSPSGLTRF